MIGSAPEHLERAAIQYAAEAVRLDRNGNAELAVKMYEKAIDVLSRLCALYPNAPQNRVYLEHIETYKERIRLLKDGLSKDSLKVGYLTSARTEPLALTRKPKVRWSDIADLEEAKRAVCEAIVYPVRRPDLFPLGWPRGILLFGPPGCGKTLLAAAVAAEIDAVFFNVDAASVMSKWLGESEKNVAQLFEGARRAAESGKPAIIFIDEVDSLMGVRMEEVGGEVRSRNQFLKEMDGLQDKNRDIHVYVIGATNKPWALDEPFIRRFQKRIYIALPNYEARLEILKLYSKDLLLGHDVNLEDLASMMEGYSASDIKDIFQYVQLKVVREFFEKGERGSSRPRPLAMEDFREALRKRKPSVTAEMVRYYQKWYEMFKGL